MYEKSMKEKFLTTALVIGGLLFFVLFLFDNCFVLKHIFIKSIS
ncbi:hypothetical protein M2256_001420 [Lactococcus lactis]|uniref:Uncharacterized protein n=1 Tax=Lactococcus lactis TaxID=1358 RepID=A0AAW5TRQ6_9LACT|nr:hypothetical protein [Lactococcus lactis]